MSRLKKQMIQRQELLPGIPDDITLDLITTKLPWSAVRKLALLSSGWQQAIQTRKIYNARVRSNSTETLIFMEFEDGRSSNREPCAKQCLSIYSSRDSVFHSLPSIPDAPEGISQACRLVSCDGKLYVLGRTTDITDEHAIVSNKVYVLDLAVGQTHWKEVSSMQKPRRCFELGFEGVVADGKIYAFGGRSGSEVYDPEVNAWSIVPIHDPGSIMSMVSKYAFNLLLIVDEGFCVVGYRDERWWFETTWFEIYHRGKNDWRKVERFRRDGDEVLFVANGKLHSISECTVSVYNIAKESWTLLHSFSFDGEDVQIYSVVALESELLAKVNLGDLQTDMEECFIRSRGFGSKSERIAWNKVCNTFDYNPYGPLVQAQL